MFGLFKSSPEKKMQKEYESLMEKAMHAQRNGKMDVYAELASKADKIFKEIEKIKAEDK
jgi:hypothetical protein